MSASYDPGVKIDRFAIAEGIDAWIATGRGEGHRAGVSTDRIEIDTQFSGCSQRGTRVLRRGMLHHTNPAEPYSFGYSAEEEFAGMGITIDPAVIRANEPGWDLRVVEDAATSPELLAALEGLYACWLDGEPLPVEDVAAAVRAHLTRVCELQRDPLARARQMLEQYFDRELYLAHVAEEVGMGELQLLRQFARRYGITPVRYRTAVRLTRAGRLAWSCPEMTVAELASAVGIEHVGFFHRSYRAYFGATPAVHRVNRRAA